MGGRLSGKTDPFLLADSPGGDYIYGSGLAYRT